MNYVPDKLPNVGTTIFTVMSKLAHDYKAINLAQGFPNFDMPQRLKDLMNHYIQNGHNQYAPMGGLPVLNEQLAIKLESLYPVKVKPSTEITVTAGATQAIYTAITAFVERGDEVILIDPAYDCYRPTVELCGGIPVIYELSLPDFKINWDDFKKLITDKTRMIVVNTPHNPIAQVFEEADWLALQEIVRDTDILLLSDEVYEHIVYDNQPHQSILRFPELWERTLATYSFGKTFHNTGWKTGYIVGPERLMNIFRKVHQFNVFCVHAPTQFAFAEFLKDPEEYLSLSAFYQEKRDFFAKITEGSRFKFYPSKGSYFQLASYSAISDEKDTDFAIRMTKEYGVAVIPVSVFYSSGRDEQLVRFCFAKTNDILEKAGKMLRKI